MSLAEIARPTPEEQQSAREAEASLRRLLEGRFFEGQPTPRAELHIEGAQEVVALSPSMLRLLDVILGANASGQGVMVLPTGGELSPNQAAEILGVSRPFLTKLMDEGKIPFRRVGAHRRVRVEALEAYQKAEEERQLAILVKLQEQAQELNMGY